MKHVWFDVASVVQADLPDDRLRQIAARIRQIGVERVLYGSDAAASPDAYPQAGWAAFRRLPLSEAEFRLVADNITPYMGGDAARGSKP
jgi:predicted TIM-barrel fold metal-dependent hydrolase